LLSDEGNKLLSISELLHPLPLQWF